MRKRKNVNKKILKHVTKKCIICEKEDVAELECHRIVPGCEGGKYTHNNTVVLCADCHTLVHKERIIIDKWYDSTTGRVLIAKKDGIEILCKEAKD